MIFGFGLADVAGAGCGDPDVVGYFAVAPIGRAKSSGPRSALKRHGRTARWLDAGRRAVVSCISIIYYRCA